MTDSISKEQRSKNMAAIHSKNTKPELYIRKLLFARGYRYRICSSKIPGRPDIYLRKYNTAIFINGCFGHHHAGCKYASMSKTNVDYWQKKFTNNIEHDNRIKEQLETLGVRQLVVWECTVKKMQHDDDIRDAELKVIKSFMLSDKQYEEI